MLPEHALAGLSWPDIAGVAEVAVRATGFGYSPQKKENVLRRIAEGAAPKTLGLKGHPAEDGYLRRHDGSLLLTTGDAASYLREDPGSAEETYYLQALEDSGLGRGAGRATGGDGRVVIKVLYFIKLATISGKDGEDLSLPASVTSVAGLLAWLRKRGDDWNEAFTEERVQVTVNKHFAEPFTLIEAGDEVAIVPRP